MYRNYDAGMEFVGQFTRDGLHPVKHESGSTVQPVDNVLQSSTHNHNDNT